MPREIIISDDGSTDGTLREAESILENAAFSWKIVRNAGECGVAGNFLNAIRICSGDVVFTCDQDDVWVGKNRKLCCVFSKRMRVRLQDFRYSRRVVA